MQTPSGTAVAGATIDVYNAGGTVHATIYSDDGVTTTTNPLTTASDGTFGFYAADGRYDLKVSGTGVTTKTFSDVEIFDATEKNAADGTLQATNANITNLTVATLTSTTNNVVTSVVSGNETVGGTLQVTGATTLNSGTLNGSFGGNPTLSGNLLISGTLGVTGVASFKNLEQVRYADQFSGADMGAKIAAAIADLPTSGGIVDATSFQGTQSAAATINVNKPCLVKIGAATLQLSGSPGINLSNTGAALIGLGPGASFLQVNSGTNDAIQSNAINVMAKGFSINSAVARTSGAAIRCKGGNGVYEDFTIDKTFNGIQITDSLSGASGNNVFKRIVMGSLTSPGGSWNAGIILGGVASGTVTGEFFQDVVIIGTSNFADAMCVLDSGCDTNHFTDCQFVQSGTDSFCLSLRNTNTSNDPQWDKFTNCVFEAGNTKTAVTVSAGILTNFVQCTLATCQVFFQFNGGKSIHVTECKMVGCQQNAINLTAGTDIKIISNRIADSSIQTSGGFNAVQVSANVTDFSIIDNDFTTILSSANQPFNNISIPAGTSDRYWIYGNTFANSNGAGLNDAGTGTNKFTGLNSPFSVGNIWEGPQSLIGTISKYNNISTVSNGVPSEVATVDLTAQTANIGSTTLYAVPSTGAGLYRISAYWIVTSVGTTSTLPSLVLGWTDRDNSTAQSTTTAPGTPTGNTLTTLAGLSSVISAKASTNLTYQTTNYASTGSAMQYALRIKVEAL